MLQAGDTAPDFDLPRDGGGRIVSTSLRGKRHVLYFYPKDNTPGCTRQACAVRDQLAAFDDAGVSVLGVSADPVKAHDRFVQKHALNFPLLSDPEHLLIDAYGVWVEKILYGRRYFGILRSTFVIGSDGRIEKVWAKASPERHAGDLLAYLHGDRSLGAT